MKNTIIVTLSSGKELKFKNAIAVTDKLITNGANKQYARTGELYIEQEDENDVRTSIATFAAGVWHYYHIQEEKIIKKQTGI